jgi:hypothetical protein
MLEAINGKVIERLKAEFLMKQTGNHLRGGKCPSCEKKTLWTWLEKPGSIQCDRATHCGFQATSKELFPDLFENLNKNYQATNDEPNRTADAYLSLQRGLDISQFQGWYTQGKYWNPNGDKGTATVRFFLDDEKTLYWERFIEPVTITDPEDGSKSVRKSAFNKSFKGIWWQPPGMTIELSDTIYLCESIIDALSLIQSGYKAVSIMSSGTFPELRIKEHSLKNINWVIALDNDKAGREALHKHAKKLRELRQKVSCILSSEDDSKEDWNDLLKKNNINPEQMLDYRYFGSLELAQNINEKALIIWKYKPDRTYFCTTYGNRTYRVKINKAEFDKVKADFLAPDANREEEATDHAFISTSQMNEIATFKMDFLYFQQSENGEEEKYFFKISYANGSPARKEALPGKVFASATKFKEVLLQAPGGQFTGNTKDVDYLYKHSQKHQPKIVKTIDYIGYNIDHDVYVFEDYAVEKGNIIALNNEDFFQLKKLAIKSTHELKQTLTTQKPIDFIDDFKLAFGTKGLIVMAAFVGALFAEQIRHKQRSFPFIEVWGEANAGKSPLLDFLWKLYGRKTSTFNPNTSSGPGRTRKLSEVSNMPVVFNETEHDDGQQNHFKKFTWSDFLDLFDGEIGRVTGVRSGDNKTRLPIFKGVMIAVQNPKITGSEAVVSRFVSINFDRSHHSAEGRLAADRLNDMEIKSVSGFLLNTLQKTDPVLKRYSERFNVHLKTLQQNPNIKLQRISQNHAQLMALSDCLSLILPINDLEIKNMQQQLMTMAVEKQNELNEDHPVVQQFWANFDYLNSNAIGDYKTEHLMNHSTEPELEIAVNLEHFNQQVEKFNLTRIVNSDLRKYLSSSRSRKFKETKPMHSSIEKRTVRCWIFKTGR